MYVHQPFSLDQALPDQRVNRAWPLLAVGLAGESGLAQIGHDASEARGDGEDIVEAPTRLSPDASAMPGRCRHSCW
jgi:hypothetical protein